MSLYHILHSTLSFMWYCGIARGAKRQSINRQQALFPLDRHDGGGLGHHHGYCIPIMNTVRNEPGIFFTVPPPPYTRKAEVRGMSILAGKARLMSWC